MKIVFFFILAIMTARPAWAEIIVVDDEPAVTLKGLWHKYAATAGQGGQPDSANPGRCQAQREQVCRDAASYGWDLRPMTYELYFESSRDLSARIYSLALHSGDISAEVSRERFMKGVSGFHYSINQICVWMNDVWEKGLPLDELEYEFMNWLIEDEVVAVIEGRAKPGLRVNHILGVAPSKKRDMAAALAHERLHVLWDEDISFKGATLRIWAAMTEAERTAVFETLPGYSREEPELLIEEWAVRSNEQNGPYYNKIMGVEKSR